MPIVFSNLYVYIYETQKKISNSFNSFNSFVFMGRAWSWYFFSRYLGRKLEKNLYLFYEKYF
mgnify:CR=1 FL=1